MSLIREKGTQCLTEREGVLVSQAATLWARGVEANSKCHRDKVSATQIALMRRIKCRIDDVTSIEVERWMNWEDIDVKTKQIYIRKEVSKQHKGILERLVDMSEPRMKSQKFFEKKTGQIVSGSLAAPYERRRKVALAIGWEEWPDNAMRHSFANYQLGRCGNAGLTAFQMGHTSPTMGQRVYAVPAVRADWKAWWKI